METVRKCTCVLWAARLVSMAAPALAPFMTLLLLVLQASLLGQATLPRSEDEFKAASPDARRELFLQVVRGTDGLAPEELAAVLRASLADPDRGSRESGLAMLTFRVLGTGTLPRGEVHPDRAALQGLRPLVESLLKDDPEDVVREGAVTALASFGYEFSDSTTRLNANTARILVERYYADNSPGVKANVVGVLIVDPGDATEAVGAVLKGAIAFPDEQVRHAALGGLDKLGSEGRALLFSALRDPDIGVRRQAAVLVSQRGDLGPADVSAIESSLGTLQDPQLRQALERAAIRAKAGR
jgi:hypothetical protein